jgi:hypothetical protein
MDINLGTLLGSLDGIEALPLVFRYDGRSVRPGYHLTEVTSGQFDALDCGANTESWTEIFIQLWDVDEEGRTHMPAGKFCAIIRKVSERVGLPRTARLTFEVTDGIHQCSSTARRCHRADREASMSNFSRVRQAASHVTAGCPRALRRRLLTTRRLLPTAVVAGSSRQEKTDGSGTDSAAPHHKAGCNTNRNLLQQKCSCSIVAGNC